MKIGIVGATGMLGNHVLRGAIEKGYEVFVIHRPKSDLAKIQGLNFTSRVGDLNDKTTLIESLKGLDMVLNCGAYYPTIPVPLEKEMQTARLQMENYIEAVQKANISKALYLGGSIALPKSPTGIGDETLIYDHAPENKTPYVQVKWLMDKMAREAGLIIGIPSMTFGEYDYGPTTGRLVMDLANGNLPAYIQGERNIIYAGDAGRGLLLAAEKGRAGERYLLTGENTNMDNLVRLIAKVAGVEPPTKVIPLKIAKMISKYEAFKYQYLGGKLPKLSGTTIAIMSAGQFLDGSKAQKELGYTPSVSGEEAIRRAIIWFKKVGYIKEGN